MDTVGQLDVFRHYGYTLSMYSTQVSIIQEAGQVIFGGLLQHLHCAHLEVQIVCCVCQCYLTEQVWNGLLADEELGTLLVLAYLTESHCPLPVPSGPLQPPLQNSLWGLPLTMGLKWLASTLDVGPPPPPPSESVARWVMTLVTPPTSSPSNCLSLLISSCEGVWPQGCPCWGTPPPPCPQMYTGIGIIAQCSTRKK